MQIKPALESLLLSIERHLKLTGVINVKSAIGEKTGETDTSLSFFIDFIEKIRIETFSPYISKKVWR